MPIIVRITSAKDPPITPQITKLADKVTIETHLSLGQYYTGPGQKRRKGEGTKMEN